MFLSFMPSYSCLGEMEYSLKKHSSKVYILQAIWKLTPFAKGQKSEPVYKRPRQYENRKDDRLRRYESRKATWLRAGVENKVAAKSVLKGVSARKKQDKV